jgi:PIN domain nuclease of toxin-antitoxin system
MPYVIDAHALVWHLTNDAKLSADARAVMTRIDNGKDKGLVPTVVLAEILYASERGRIALTLDDVLKELRKRKHYRIEPFSRAVLIVAQKINIPELHDRLIVATAIHRKAGVITRDEDIMNSGIVKTVW